MSYRYDYSKLSEKMAGTSFWIPDNKVFIISKYRLNVSDIREQLEEFTAIQKVDMVIIDYIQKIHPETQRNLIGYEKASLVSNQLKELQKDRDIPFFVLSQLNREFEKGGKSSGTSNLKGSGAIEEDSDQILICTRENERMTVKIEKNKHGEAKHKVPCQFIFQGGIYNLREVPEEDVKIQEVFNI